MVSDPLAAAAPTTLILALGNPLRGDDGVAAAVLQQLGALPLPPDIALLDGGTPGLETVLLLEGYDRALIIDAAEMGLSPGEWRIVALDAVQLLPGDDALQGTLHSAGVAEALTLGAALGILPPQIVIVGIQPQSLDWIDQLSPAVQAAIPAVCAAVHHELVTMHANAGGNHV